MHQRRRNALTRLFERPLRVRHLQRNLRRLGVRGVGFLVLGLFALLAPRGIQAVETEAKEESQITTETQDEVRKDPLLTTDVDPAATEFDVDINYNVDRRAEVSVPGTVNENEAVGILIAANMEARARNPHPPRGPGRRR